MKKLKVRQAFKNKKIVAAVVVSTLLATGAVSAYTVNQSSGADPEPPIVTEVNRQGEQLDNHEGRITNAENDINTLQQNTGTAPSSTRVEVPTVTTTTSTPQQAPAPAAVVVTAYRQIVVSSSDINCEYTYSDGSAHTFLWKHTFTNGSGQLQTTTVGYCSDQALGQPRV